MYGHRILILAPHPDDELVGVAIAIRRACAAGAAVAVLYLTTGIPDPALCWPWQRGRHAQRLERRQQEARAAAAALGFEILGFASRPTRSLKDHLAAALNEIEAGLESWKPDRLWVPAYEGAHQDHDAAHLLGACVAKRLPVLEFAEYNFCGGQVRSQEFPVSSGKEMRLALTVEEAAEKRRLLALYASERGNLGHIRAGCEVLRPLRAADYRRPPHEGLQFYQRFQWVPFRHPRIDFTTPQEVCARLAPFAAAQGVEPAGGS